MHRWTDEDACFAAAQWASGIKQREIGEAFGYKHSVTICQQIERFIHKYCEGLALDYRHNTPTIMAFGKGRLALVKPAIAEFVRQRNARLDP
jgi:hypothetical protein